MGFCAVLNFGAKDAAECLPAHKVPAKDSLKRRKELPVNGYL